MRFVIVGAGAVGGTLGARLIAAGRDVALVARGEHGAAIRRHGLRLDAPDGSLVVTATVHDRIDDVAWRGDDVVLLCVKTHQAADALRDLARRTAAPIACLTNGLETERLALRSFADVHAVCVYTPATHLEPGVVQQWSSPLRGILDVGRYPRGTTPLDTTLAEAFTAAGFAAEPRDDIMAHKRTKLLSNLSNALDAMLGEGGRDHPLVDAAQREAIAVYDAAGLSRVGSIEDDPRRKRMPRGEIVGARRAGGSTWQSVARGARELETDYLNGEIALLGRLHGVPTPINVKLQRLAAAFAAAGRAPGSLDPAELD